MKFRSGIEKCAVWSVAVFTLSLFTLQVLAQQGKVVSVYHNETEITDSKSVTLTNGFYAPAGSKLRVYISRSSFKDCVTPFAGLPSTDQNYVSTKVFKVPGVLTDADVAATGRTVCDVNQTVQYLDGLGRPVQAITTQGSPTYKDVVQPLAYDGFNRETTKYLPYTTGGAAGSYRTDALNGTSGYGNSAQKMFYSVTGQGYLAIPSPYSQTVIESSPLNRVLQQGAPGDVWQPASNRTNLNGRTVVTQYGTNIAEVKLWTVVPGGATSSGNYAAGKLSKLTSRDENWIEANGKAGTVDQYKDIEDRVVLKRVWESDTKSLSTYYVYDDQSNLRYVLPPAVNENGQNPVNSFTENDAVFNNFIYGYRYDWKNRVAEKKIPGKGWERMVYNKYDQIVLTQDSVQKNGNQWVYNKYDALGRVVSSGIYTNALNTSRLGLQAIVDAQTAFWENRTGLDYSNAAFPQSGTEQHLINYYDDYKMQGLPYDQSSNYSKKTRSLLTASKVKVLGTTNDYLWTVTYYDEEARPVKIYKQHYLGGTVNPANYDEVENIYSFAGELTGSNKIHHLGSNTTTIANRYEYDHMGRKLATFEKINADPEIVINYLTYNEVGQLFKKSLHSTDQVTFLQDIIYTYNPRGWLSKSKADLFSFDLKYENGAFPQFNGNIANQAWGTNDTNPNVYTYKYDALNRLVSGVSTGVVMSEALTYDEMGNIKSLTRDGASAGLYNYGGNKLNQITGGISTGVYQYDGNGNATTDGRNGVTLTYNRLNLPATVSKSGLTMGYTYDAVGTKLKKVSNGAARDYIDGIEYNAGVIEIIHTEEGVARRNGANYSYEYNLSDHLGNVRVSFYKNPIGGVLEVIQKDNYYPFGQRKLASAGQNKYLYNGKELQDELGQYDYGARFYDPVIGRWNVSDPLAEKYFSHSPYIYVVNNPLTLIDPNGMEVDDSENSVNFSKADAVAMFYILTSKKKSVYIAIERDEESRKNMDRREKEDGNGQWAVFGTKDFKTASAVMGIFKAKSLDNLVLETHGGHSEDGSFIRVNDMSNLNPNFSNPDNYIYNNEIADYVSGKGSSNVAEISQLQNMASKIKNGGKFVLSACVGASFDSKSFAENMAKLTGNRLNIYYPKDYVHAGAYPSGPWKGTRSVNRELRVTGNKGWFSILPNGNASSFKTGTISQNGLVKFE